jgi:hypothetical protein
MEGVTMEYLVVCTDRGQHGRTNFERLTRYDDGTVTENRAYTYTVRMGDDDNPDPVYDDEGAVVVPKSVGKASQRVHHWNGQERWQWKCPRCKRDVRLSGENLRRWMDATPTPVLDVSWLPTL